MVVLTMHLSGACNQNAGVKGEPGAGFANRWAAYTCQEAKLWAALHRAVVSRCRVVFTWDPVSGRAGLECVHVFLVLTRDHHR